MFKLIKKLEELEELNKQLKDELFHLRMDHNTEICDLKFDLNELKEYVYELKNDVDEHTDLKNRIIKVYDKNWHEYTVDENHKNIIIDAFKTGDYIPVKNSTKYEHVKINKDMYVEVSVSDSINELSIQIIGYYTK